MGCNSRPESESVHTKLNDMSHKLQLEGYFPPLQWASQVISDDEEENMLCGHTEKLGMTVALMNSPEVHLYVLQKICMFVATAILLHCLSQKWRSAKLRLLMQTAFTFLRMECVYVRVTGGMSC